MRSISKAPIGAVIVSVVAIHVTDAEEALSASYDRTADQHGFTIFMEDGGWCWFQDPRAIIDSGRLIVGSVQGNGKGAAKASIYDLLRKKQLGVVTLHDNFRHDDHNAPRILRPAGWQHPGSLRFARKQQDALLPNF